MVFSFGLRSLEVQRSRKGALGLKSGARELKERGALRELTTDHGLLTTDFVSSSHIDLLDQQDYASRHRPARNSGGLEGPIAQRPPELLDQVRVLWRIKHVHKLTAALRINLDQRGHALIARLLIRDVAEAHERAIIQHARKFVIMLTVNGVRIRGQIVVAVKLAIGAIDYRVYRNLPALGAAER